MKFPVEAVVWNDASKENRKPFSVDHLILVSLGFIIHEDTTQIILCSEIENTLAWKGEDMDYTQIPKRVIKKRVVLGEVDVPVGLVKKVRRSVRDAKAGPEGVVGIPANPVPSGQ